MEQKRLRKIRINLTHSSSRLPRKEQTEEENNQRYKTCIFLRTGHEFLTCNGPNWYSVNNNNKTFIPWYIIMKFQNRISQED